MNTNFVQQWIWRFFFRTNSIFTSQDNHFIDLTNPKSKSRFLVSGSRCNNYLKRREYPEDFSLFDVLSHLFVEETDSPG